MSSFFCIEFESFLTMRKGVFFGGFTESIGLIKESKDFSSRLLTTSFFMCDNSVGGG